MTTHLVWFRQDLRQHDNLALAAACRNSSARVLALYIATPRQWAAHNVSPRQAELINTQLNALQNALAEKGIPLLFREVDDFAASVETVKQVCAENRITHLFYNYQYEVNERARDVQAERTLRNVVCEGFDDSVILPPGAVMTGNHEMYKVFTPFKNAWLKRLREGMPECVAAPKFRSSGSIEPAPSITLNYPRQSFDTAHFPVEEKRRLRNYASFARTVPESMSNNEIFRQWKAPVVCPPAWQRAGYRLANVYIACWRNNRRCWKADRGASGLMS